MDTHKIAGCYIYLIGALYCNAQIRKSVYKKGISDLGRGLQLALKVVKVHSDMADSTTQIHSKLQYSKWMTSTAPSTYS